MREQGGGNDWRVLEKAAAVFARGPRIWNKERLDSRTEDQGSDNQGKASALTNKGSSAISETFAVVSCLINKSDTRMRNVDLKLQFKIR